ncbi:MurNAc alpha-1-phosphate uridylyltransferase [Kushneria sinocarnis]|uniref:MurNAc alpha-1-phosphate uridylyltransferase n=1 Tax=Kushneria sinocarnis TaxID=595502 RepID=A0A420WZ92_9GAMM|nr:nucleotidyltransferase family protein [Kushneria sinocarnis]RKR06600.1 MurNAc alpha-1-phosphate uridylyltransferase [Kushneria sinocarnis]
MKAMILAAGFGRRMRPLTEHTPKPLLEAGGRPLIVHHLERLRRAGIREVVINVSHLAERLIEALGDGRHYDISIRWSREDTPLETAGGIRHALPLLDEAPFLLINGDVWCDLDPGRLALAPNDLAQLVMVDNPPQHSGGDFHLDDADRLHPRGEPKLTYAGIALLHPELIAGVPEGEATRLAPLLIEAMQHDRVGGYHYHGDWDDIGTPERLAALDARLPHP